MNFKKFMTLIVVLMTVALFSNSVLAQTTFYVDNAAGSDANSGLSGSPKATLGSALIAAPIGSTISIKATGIVYSETLPTTAAPQTYGTVPPITYYGISKNLTITSTGGTPEFIGTFQVGVDTANVLVASKKVKITFTGPVQFDGGLNLTNGTLAGGNFVTVKSQVYRTELGSITSGQLNFSGTVNFVYETALAAATITTGLEFPTTATVAGNLSTQPTHGALTLTLNQNATISGVLFTDALATTTSAPLNLGGFTLTLNNTTVATTHSVRSDVTNGTLAFATTTGGANINSPAASAKLPNITATTDKAADAATLTIGANISTIGNITASLGASITSSNSGAVGNVTLNGSGNINTLAQTGGATAMAGAVVASAGSTGNIEFQNTGAGAAYKLASITESGMGQISFNAGINTVNVTGNVLLNTAFTYVLGTTTSPVIAPTTNKALILFPSTPVTIGGTLTNSASFAGNTDLANDYNGIIQFNTGTLTVTGLTLNNATGTVTYAATTVGPLTAAQVGASNTRQGDILFANGASALTFAGVTNSAALSSGTGSGGRINPVGSGAVTTGAVLNNSTYVGANIDFSNASAFTSASLTESGSVVGGQIIIGNGTAITGDITNSRTVAGSDINIGTLPTAGVAVTVGTVTVSGKSNVNFVSTTTGLVKATSFTVTASATAGILFPNVTTATLQIANITQAGGVITFNATNTSVFTITSWNISAGTITFGNGNGLISASATATSWVWSAGTIDFGTAARTVTFNGASLQIGGDGTKVTFSNGNAAILDIEQFYPNGVQAIKLGTLDQRWPGSVNVGNGALIPAPYVVFQTASASGAVGNLYILNGGTGVPVVANGLTFNTGGTVLNTVELNNVAIYVGKNDNPIVNGGNFQNTTGYVSINNGYINMASGVGGQSINTVAATAGATFGNLAVTAINGITVTIATPITLSDPNISGVQTTSDFRLATGTVGLSANITFNGIATAPWPTIYRTEGNFNTWPTVATGTFVSVTYYGNDKTASFEIPNTNALFNLHVATTNGAKNGFGIIIIASAVTVNGTLTIDANQALETAGNVLTIAGSTAVVNGYLSDNGTNSVVLAAANGTTISGTGLLPSLTIADKSNGNSISGLVGLYSNILGSDFIWGGAGAAADNTTLTNGTIIFLAGANASGLTVTFTAPAAGAANFSSLTMNGAGNGGKHYFNLNANAIMSGAIDVEGGVIALNKFTLTQLGPSTFTFNATAANGSQITSTSTPTLSGALVFNGGGTTLTATTTDVPAGKAVIAANVIFNGGAANYVIPAASAANFQFNNNVTLNDVSGPLGSTITIGASDILYIGGANLKIAANSGFDPASAGILDLFNASPFTLLTATVASANTTVPNLTIDGNVTLAGSLTGGTLKVTTAFILNPGSTSVPNDLNLSTANLEIDGNFTVNGGMIDPASTGWLIWNSAGTFHHSALWNASSNASSMFSINNFQVEKNLTLLDKVNLNVLNKLTLGDASDQAIVINNFVGTPAAAPGYLTVGLNNAVVPMVTIWGTSSISTNPIVFKNKLYGADFTLRGNGGATIDVNTWPADLTVGAGVYARNLWVNLTAPATTLITQVSRTVKDSLYLTQGQLVIPTGVTFSLPNANALITRTVDGSIIATGTTPGVLSGSNVSLTYLVGTASGDFSTSVVSGSGIEYSSPTIFNITVGKFPVPSSAPLYSVVITLNAKKTIYGILKINGTLTMPATTLASSQTGGTGGSIVMTDLLKINAIPTGYSVFNNFTGPIYSNDSLSISSYNTGYVAFPTAIDPVLTMAGKRNLTIGSITGTGNLLIGTVNQSGSQSSITITGASTLVGSIKVTGNVILKASTSIASTTNLQFIGNANAALAVPSSVTVGSITLSKGLNTSQIAITGTGDVTTTGNPSVIFVNGLLLTGTNILYINAPLFGGGQGFDRSGVTGTNVSHVVGNVGRKIVNTGLSQQAASSEPRQEFPVGTLTGGFYRPAAITFLPTSFGVSTVPNVNLVVSHQTAEPTGTVGLPITDGVAPGMGIGNYAPFYWTITAKSGDINLSFPVNFELTAPGFTSQPAVDFKLERIISRFGGIQDSTNSWSTVLGTVYANELNTMTVIQEGMVPTWRKAGAIYTIGSTSVLAMTNPPSAINVAKPNGPVSIAISNSFSNVLGTINYQLAAVSDSTIAKVSVSTLVNGSFLNITPLANGTTNLTMQAVDVNKTTGTVYGVVSFTIPVNVSDAVVGVAKTDALPTEFALFQNYPNPFNPTTMIKFDLPKETNVKLKVYNILGAEVATLVNSVMPAGHQSVAFNAARFASGMYIYRIEAGSFVQVKKMILMK